MSVLRNRDGFEESKRHDQALIEQMNPYLKEAVHPYLPSLAGRDIDMMYTHRTMQIVTDFKRPEEIYRPKDNWYYAYREMAWKDNIVMCAVLEDRSDVHSISKLKLLTKQWETGYIDCDFDHYMALNKFFIDTAEQRIDWEYRKRVFRPKIANEREYANFCKREGIKYL